MIKVNEQKILDMINNSNLKGIDDYIKLVLEDSKVKNKSQLQKIKAFRSLSQKMSKNMKLAYRYAIEKDNKMLLTDGYLMIAINKKIEGCFVSDNQPKSDLFKLLEDIKESNKLDCKFNFKDFQYQLKKYKATKEKKPTIENHGIFKLEHDSNNCTYVDIKKLETIHKVCDLSNSKIILNSNPYNAISIFSIDNFIDCVLCPIRLPKK